MRLSLFGECPPNIVHGLLGYTRGFSIVMVVPLYRWMVYFMESKKKCGGFLSHGGSPSYGWLIVENPKQKWMIFWGYPHDFGKLHILEAKA